ncbi:HYR domain-containing protein [Maribacter algarum]|uniref:HYR domain-containing protein n=1 Tax=Maribacter algarum (ex Zhang et al. 2020) TaxID=2578118 RepID=A0A5S3PMZ8_9FLAO|nr:HYR domain-containing protein [Maribacter algarum]TMM55869.1 HYR domain-containing protein [Maribacter algarum]
MKQITFLIFLFGITFASHAQDLRITEIMYNPSNADSAWEWIEVYNAGTELADLTGFVIDDNSGASYSEANIPSGTILSGKSAILFNASVLSESDFRQVWGTVDLIPVIRWSSLNNGGDTIGIWNSFESYSGDNTSQENVIEQVAYAADGEIWPEDDGSASIFLRDLDSDNNIGTNWSLSTVGIATPIFKAYASMVFETNEGEDIGSPGLPGSVDTERPMITCPEALNMVSDVDNCGATFQLPLPTATDNESTQIQFSGIRNDGLELTDLFPVGETIITWTATDETGNVSDSCMQSITVTDEVPPTLICPESIMVSSHDGNPVSIEIEAATAADVCDEEIELSFSRSDDLGLQDPYPVGMTTITWTVTDTSDNFSECEQVITVNSSASNENDITSFSVSEQTGEPVINTENKTVNLKVPFGTELESLIPTLEISTNATVTPETGVARNFSTPVEYTVTAQDGTDEIWTVIVEVLEQEEEEKDNELSVTSFMLVNAETNEDLFLLEEGMMIAIEDLPTVHLDIRANTTENVESVRISLVGAQNTVRTESLLPYALYQDLPIGDYKGNDFIPGNYTVSATPYSGDALQGEAGNFLTLNFEIIGVIGTLEIESFTLINAGTNEDLFTIEEGMVIDINSLPTNHLDIRANTTDDVESVKLSLSGSQFSARTESLEPYALFQDLPIGNYKGNNFSTGSYSVIGVPYSEDSARGSLGSSYRINFELVDSSLQVIDFMLVNADTDEDLFVITEGMVIDINELPTRHLDIRANTSEDVESVRLSLSGALTSARTESLVPYALFQDLPIGDYKGSNFVVGTYTVSAIPYSENSLRGQVGMALSIDFELSNPIVIVVAEKSSSIIISPNPARTETRLSFENSVELKVIEIYDFNGRLLESFNAEGVLNGNSYLVPVSGLHPGNYILRSQDTLGDFYQELLVISRE